jgi:hypothetical protein
LTTIESPEERFSRYEDVTSAIAETGTERPTVVVMDDAHWADEPSLLPLRHIANGVADLPLVVVMTARDVEPQSRLRNHLAGLIRVSGAARLDLRGLAEEDVRTQLSLIVDVGVAEDWAREVADVTGVTRSSSASSPGRWPTAPGRAGRHRRPFATLSSLASARFLPTAEISSRWRRSSGATSRSS